MTGSGEPAGERQPTDAASRNENPHDDTPFTTSVVLLMYLAIFELRLESLRRPALAAAIDEQMAAMAAFTGAHRAVLGLETPPAAVGPMLVMYGGALFALVTGPAEAVTHEMVRPLAVAIVEGGLAAARS